MKTSFPRTESATSIEVSVIDKHFNNASINYYRPPPPPESSGRSGGDFDCLKNQTQKNNQWSNKGQVTSRDSHILSEASIYSCFPCSHTGLCNLRARGFTRSHVRFTLSSHSQLDYWIFQSELMNSAQGSLFIVLYPQVCHTGATQVEHFTANTTVLGLLST